MTKDKAKIINLSELKNMKLSGIIFMIIGGFLTAVAVNLFYEPAGLYDSGISGTAMLLDDLTPENLTLALFLIVLNIPLFAFGMKREGTLFTVYSLIAVAVYALSSFLMVQVFEVNTSVSPLAGSDIFLCSIFGGLIAGTGSGLAVRFGGAIDGVEVLAVIFAKKLNLTVGSFIMIFNVILYIAAGIIFSSWEQPLYSIVAFYIALKAIDFIVEGFDKTKSVTIITSKGDEVCEALSQEFGIGITQIEAKGYYSGEKKTSVYFVINRFQISKLTSIIHRTDPDAFITIAEVTDVLSKNI